jgi:hypothetical protein
MSDSERKVVVTDGNNTWVDTVANFERMNYRRPVSMPKLSIVGDAKHRAVSTNQDGELVDELVSAETLATRAKFGEFTSANKASIEAARQDAQRKIGLETADEEDLLSFARSSVPGIQYVENQLVGEDEANKARSELAVNAMPNMAGNLVEYLAGGRVIGGLAGKAVKGALGAERAAHLGTAIGLGSTKGRPFLSAGKIIAEDVAIESHFYFQSLAEDTNKEFQAEDWMQQVAIGAMFATPFVLGAAGRGVGGAIAKKVGSSDMLQTLGTGLTTMAVMSAPGKLATAKLARSAAGVKLLGKLTRKGKAKGLSAVDEGLQAQLLDALDDVGGLTPGSVAKMSPAKRLKYIERVKPLLDEGGDMLDDIQWESIPKRTRNMTSKVEGFRKTILGLHTKLDGGGTGVKITNRSRDKIITEANVLISQMTDEGMAPAAESLRRGILRQGGTPESMHKALFEARINARFRRGMAGGAEQADDSLRAFTENTEIFSPAQVKKNKIVNDAIDEVVDTWDDLGQVHLARDLDNVEISDGIQLQKLQGQVARIEKAMSTLEDADMLTAGQGKALKTKLIETEKAIIEGTQAYADAIKVNRARHNAAALLQKRSDVLGLDIPKTQGDYQALLEAGIKQTATDMVTFGSKVGNAILSQTPLKYATRGVGALHSMAVEDKYAAFEIIQQNLDASVGNAGYATDNLEQILAQPATYDPHGADIMGMKTTNAMHYLQSQLPRRPQGFYTRDDVQPLSKVEEFMEKYAAALDPISVGYAGLDGSITKSMVDSIRATSPAMYAELQVIVSEQFEKVRFEETN